MAIPIGLIIAGAMSDWRVVILGLMILFIVYPMVMTFAMLRYAAMPMPVGRASVDSVELLDTGKLRLLRRVEPDGPAEVVEELMPKEVRVEKRRLVIITGPSICDFFLLPLSDETIGIAREIEDAFSAGHNC